MSCMGFSCEKICNAVVLAIKLKMDDFRGQGQDCAYDRREIPTAQNVESFFGDSETQDHDEFGPSIQTHERCSCLKDLRHKDAYA